MRKRVYRGVAVDELNVAKLREEVRGRRVVFGVDVGKEVMAGAVMTESREVVTNVTWRNPFETGKVLDVLESLEASDVEVALEPSGTYGDAFRHQCRERSLAVYRVSAKRSHDAAEVYDGVPSWHDVKSAGVVARLHVDGASHVWREREEDERELAAAVRLMGMHDGYAQSNLNRLEALLSRHWPEVREHVGLESMTLNRLLEASGGPEWVGENAAVSRERMRQWGRTMLRQEAIEGVIESAQQTMGVPMIEAEVEMIRQIAAEVVRSMQESRKAYRRVARLIMDHDSGRLMVKPIGIKATASIVAAGMDPVHYEEPTSLVKALGLNLKERSSGKYKGELKITKRGPGICRFYLYLAVLRLIVWEPELKKWYDAKVLRDGGKVKNKAIIALMRKVVRALWHVARGAEFDASLLVRQQ